MTDLIPYALAQTYRIVSYDRNHKAALCYACDAPLATDQGYHIQVRSFHRLGHRDRFLCSKCFLPIRLAHETYNEFRPAWWGELDRPARAHDTRSQPPRPGPREIDALIAEREQEQANERDRDTPTPDLPNPLDPT